MIGQKLPITNEATINAIPTTASFQPERLSFFWIRPNTTANTINIIDTVPAEPLVEAAGANCDAPSTTVYALNVPATISANAAITISVNNQQKSKKILRPNLPIYFSMIIPIDLPSFLTEAYKAPKSVTAPKNTPPIRIQSNTGNHPNAAA